MDVSARNPYVRSPMTNLLLLLSAMLSALIGVGPVTRTAQVPVAVASAASQQAVPVAARAISATPHQPLATISGSLVLGAMILSIALRLFPAWKMRRRE